MNTTILLFTRSFPYYSLENYFLQHEIYYLKKEFNELIIFPLTTTGFKQETDPKVFINDGFSNYLNKYKKSKNLFIFKSFFSSLLYKELLIHPEILIKPYRFFRLINSISYILYVNIWFHKYIMSLKSNADRIIIYTYWFTALTTSFGLTTRKIKNTYLISRAHGKDLYEERNAGYIPLRKLSISFLDNLFLISKHGMDYILNIYPDYSSKFKLAELGVPDPKHISSASQDKIFRIVSCSSIIRVKRIELLIESLVLFAKKNSNKKIIWTHFGGGELQNKIEILANSISLKNFKSIIMGFVQNIELLRFYKHSPVDVFINVSQSEGKPVTIMEAQSFGIPVIATSVGGIPEIVNDKNGVLLNANPTNSEVANALDWFINNPEEAIKKREFARLSWAQNCNADINFDSFATQLKKLTNN